MIRTAYFEGPWYVPLLQEAFPLWRELEASTHTSLLAMTGALMLGEPSSELVRGVLDSARRHNLEVEHLAADDVRRRSPAHVIDDRVVGVVDAAAGYVRPEAAVGAMLSLVPRVERETTVTSIDDVLTRFEAVVVAAGSWTSELVDWIPLRVERQVMTWFAIKRDTDLLQAERFPPFIRQMPEGDFVYGFPTVDGKTIKVARHHEGTPDDPEPVRHFVRDCMLGISTEIVRSVSCLYTNTPDGHFVIDFAPGDQRMLVISACSGHGFKFAPIVGDIAADLILEGKTRRDISRFSATRFATSYVPDDHHGDHHGG
jgi:sarcosine oxidase